MFSKYARFDVLEAKRAAQGRLRPHTSARRTKTAHRASFDYEPRPGYLYVRSRAISSRCNDNFDEFPADEIRQSYRTFIGKPVFVNHANDNHKRARGVVVDAVLHEDINPDGSEDTWAEVLMEVDAVRFPKLAEAIVKGHIDRTSMGTDVAYSVCSACGNKASTPLEYCFPPGALVTMADGTFRKIEDVVEGERVLTHEGPAHVTATMARDYHGLLALVHRRGYAEPLRVTHGHEVLANLAGRRDESKSGMERYASVHDPTNWDWVPVERLDEGNWVQAAFPIEEQEATFDFALAEDIVVEEGRARLAAPYRHGRRKGQVQYGKYDMPATLTTEDEGLAFVVGLYVAEGSLESARTAAGTPKCIQWSLGSHEEWLADRLQRALDKMGAGEARRYEYDGNLDVRLSNAPLAHLLERICGGSASTKTLDGSLMLAPRAWQRVMLDAYFEGDGWDDPRGHVEVRTASEVLSRQLVLLGARNDRSVPTWLRNRNQRGGPTQREGDYTIHYVAMGREGPMKGRRRLHDGFYAAQVIDTQVEDYCGPVYNLEVDGPHSYVVDGQVVHNCKHIPKMKGTVLKRRLASGKTEEVLIREICHGLGFFENSLLVEDPADPTAYTLGVDTRGLDMDPRAARLDRGDDSLRHAEARRDLGLSELPPARRPLAGRGQREEFVFDDADVGFRQTAGSVARPTRAAASSNHVGGVVGRGAEEPVRRVVARTDVAGVPNDHALGDRPNQLGEAPAVGANGRPLGIGEGEPAVSAVEGSSRPRPAGVRSTAGVDLREVPLHLRHGHGAEGSRAADHDAYFRGSPMPFSHRTEATKRHLQRVASRRQGGYGYYEYLLCPTCGLEFINNGQPDIVPPHPHGTRGGRCPGSGSQGRVASRRTAGDDISGRTTVPPQVNTLEGQECPVCGSEEFDGEGCDVCGYEAPPEQFRDPDLNKAKEFDRGNGHPQSLDDPNATPQQNGPNVPEGTPGTEAAEPGPDEFEETPVDENGDPAEVEGEPEVDEDGNPIEDEVADLDEALQQTPPEDEELLAEVNDVLREVKKIVAPEGDVPVRVQDEVRDSLNEIEEILQSVDMDEIAEGEGEAEDVEDEDAEEGDEDDDDDDDTPDFLTSDDDEDEDEEDEDDDDDDDDEDDNPFAKGSARRPVRSRRTPREGVRTSHPEAHMAGSTLKALQENARLLRQVAATQRVQQQQIDYIGKMAGIDSHLASIKRRADSDNPAQPVDEPASVAPTQTTEDARGNAGDDVTSPGSTSETDVSADAQGDVTSPGAEVTDVGAGATEDVTAPIDGTQEQRPREETVTRPDVTYRDFDPETAYPETGWTNASKESRIVAAMRLARLRIAQGIADTDDDLGLGTTIAQSKMSDHDIQSEIATLDKVAKAAGSRPQSSAARPPRRLVPRTAGGGGDRSTPSMASAGSAGAGGVLTPAAPTGVSDDEFLFD